MPHLLERKSLPREYRPSYSMQVSKLDWYHTTNRLYISQISTHYEYSYSYDVCPTVKSLSYLPLKAPRFLYSSPLHHHNITNHTSIRLLYRNSTSQSHGATFTCTPTTLAPTVTRYVHTSDIVSLSSSCRDCPVSSPSTRTLCLYNGEHTRQITAQSACVCVLWARQMHAPTT